MIENDDYFRRKSDVLGVPCVCSEVKVLAGLKILGSGMKLRETGEIFGFSESTAKTIFDHFATQVPLILSKFLRNLTKEELQRHLKSNEKSTVFLE